MILNGEPVASNLVCGWDCKSVANRWMERVINWGVNGESVANRWTGRGVNWGVDGKSVANRWIEQGVNWESIANQLKING